MTKQEIIQKCCRRENAEGPIWFIETFGRVVGAQGGRHPIVLFDFQKEYIKALLTQKVVIVNKPRQIGFSTISALFYIWEALFTPDAKIVIISINENEAISFLSKVRIAFEEMPSEIFGKLKPGGDSAMKLVFETDSSIEVRASGPNAGRGLTPTRIMLDEAAFITRLKTATSIQEDLANRIWTAIEPSLNMGGKACICSTSSGIGGWYYAMWHVAIEGTKHEGKYWAHGEKPEVGPNGMTPFVADWYDFQYKDGRKTYFQQYDQDWFNRQKEKYKREGREREFNQEVLHEFLGSGNNVVSVEKIKEYERVTKREPIWVGDERRLQIWKEPLDGVSYILSVDVASAQGFDYSTFEIFRRDGMEQVGEYKGNPKTDAFATLIYEYGKRYNNAEVVIETNYGMAWSVIEKLIELGYINIFRQDNKKEGVQVTPAIKENMVGKFKEWVANDAVCIRSQRLINELKTYVWKGNRAMAESGFNDDLVSATQLAIYCKESYKEPMDVIWFVQSAGDVLGTGGESDYAKYLKRNVSNENLGQTREQRIEQLLRRGLGADGIGLSEKYVAAYNLYYKNDLSGF